MKIVINTGLLPGRNVIKQNESLHKMELKVLHHYLAYYLIIKYKKDFKTNCKGVNKKK